VPIASSTFTAGATVAHRSTPKIAAKYNLASVCPNPIVMQTGWDPAVGNDFELYNLVASNGTINANTKSYTAEVLDQGHDTGVQMQLRVGGASVAYETGGQLMRLHPEILLADDSTDTNIEQSETFPLVDIFAPQNNNALGFLWDPATHPKWKNIADIGKSGATIIVSNSLNPAYSYLINKGIISSAQLDKAYKGSPAIFVAAEGADAEQGYADAEPWLFAHSITQWDKPVKFGLISQYGYDPYANAVATTPANITKFAACFKKLVPMMQQAGVDYVASPSRANALMVQLAATYNDGWEYPAGEAKYAAKALITYKIVENGPSGEFGGMSLKRIQSLIGILQPILSGAGITIVPDLKAQQIATNKFLNPKIALPAGE
jgi:hypothetical protein